MENWTKQNRRGTLFIAMDGPLRHLAGNFMLKLHSSRPGQYDKVYQY